MPGELPREGRGPGRSTIAHGKVPDPNPAFRGRTQRVAINIDTDALEREYKHGRIGDAAYVAARVYQRVLQRSRIPGGGGGSWNLRDRVDQVMSHEFAILTRIERATEATAMIADTAPVIGMLGQRLLELVLVEELTLTEAAQRLRGSGDRQHVIYYSSLFRDLCEALANHWCQRHTRAPRV